MRAAPKIRLDETSPARTAAYAADSFRRIWSAARRHPVRALFLPAGAVLLYVLVLIPFTPGISDIRKAKAEQPTVVLIADGKELAVFRRANREWVKLAGHFAQRGGRR